MSILFVADVHLCVEKPVITNGFINFLRTKAITAKSLYVLGDLFEFWIGDDNLNKLHYKIALEFQELNYHGVSCYFINGNRDFLLGKDYAKLCKMQLLSTYQIIKLNSINIIMLHGDSLCTKDKFYQIFRYIVRRQFIKNIFLSLCLQSRQNIFKIVKSIFIKLEKIKIKKNNLQIKGINIKSAVSLMQKTKTNLMIHGHTHKTEIHIMKNRLCRVVLGSWNKCGMFLEINEKTFLLNHFKL